MSSAEASSPVDPASPSQRIEKLYLQHRQWLLAFLSRRFGSLVGEDLAQEAFARTLASSSEVRNPRAFLAKVAIRAALEEARRRPEVGVAFEPETAVEPDAEQALMLEQAILALPAPIRDVFLLSRFGGLSNGIRARAQEVAHELLGDLSRAEAERRIWRETEAERFTGFDRRLVAAADENGLVDDGVGRASAWSALTCGRLRHLERLGLAQRHGARYRLDPNLEQRLRTLELQKDIIRLRRQRELDGSTALRELDVDRLRGHVLRSGWHDELGSAPFLIVRDTDGVEHHARLRLGQAMPNTGSVIELIRDPRGAYAINTGRGLSERGR